MKRYFYILSALLLLAACSENIVPQPESNGSFIKVGGVSTDGLTTTVSYSATKADYNGGVPAESKAWLIQPLKGGFDIRYGIPGDDSQVAVAVLKLTGGTPDDDIYNIEYDDGDEYAVYDFNYKSGEPAEWFDNGPHFFQGLYVPEELTFESSSQEVWDANSGTAKDLTKDQSSESTTVGALGNYTLLERYLSMPVDCQINATVARVKLPFKHRLAHVKAYILIDTEKMPGATLKGYELVGGKDDPTTTSLRFRQVKVLSGVKEAPATGETSLPVFTPEWSEARMVVPHFVEEIAQSIVYYDDNEKTYLHETNDGFEEAAETYQASFEKWYNSYIREGQLPAKAEQLARDTTEKLTGLFKHVYKNIPVYDIIVRPTYTSTGNVMYDEDFSQHNAAWYASQTNQISFELTLNNELSFYKDFEFDLNANEETIIYLRINSESIDYNSSGADKWIEKERVDGWYGPDNDLGHNLSPAGSSWQRAFICGKMVDGDEVTDADFYNQTTPDNPGDGQYLTDATWIEKFAQAYEGGAYHGYYFSLRHDITIPAGVLPADFVFTGHLDGQDYTITVTGGDYLFGGLNGTYTTSQEAGGAGEWEANVHLENGRWVPTAGYRAEVINTKVAGALLFKEGAEITGNVNNCYETVAGELVRVKDNTPALPIYK